MAEWREKKTKFNFLTFIVVFVFIAIVTITIIKLIKGGNTDLKTGEITYDKSLLEEEKDYFQKKIGDKKFTKDLKISARFTYNGEELKENEIIYKEYVPTVGFNQGTLNISMAEAEAIDKPISAITTNCSNASAETNCVQEYKPEALDWVEISHLTAGRRVVSIDNNYYLDGDPKSGLLRVVTFETEDFDEVKDIAKADTKPINTSNTLSFAQTGVNAISRAMLLDSSRFSNYGAYFAEKISDFLLKKDLTHISSEVSYHDGCRGGRDTMTLCSDWRTLDSIKALGTDIVELTGNHNNNYGADDNIATINKYHELGWATVGGGINETEAKKPLRIESAKTESNDYTTLQNKKGANITFIAVNQSTSTVGNGELASGDQPGANGYDEATVNAQITAAKERGDFILVDIQFSECYCYPNEGQEDYECDSPIPGQADFFRSFIDRGADMVVGTQAHQPQTFELYNGKPIYYGLGNLMFDQTYWPGTERSLILTHYFVDGKYVQTRISPTVYDKSYQPALMDEASAESYVTRLINATK